MIKGSIFDQVEQYAKRQVPKAPLSMRILYGITRIVSMDSNVLSAVFQEDKDLEEIKKMQIILQKKDYDISLMKQAIPLLFSSDNQTEDGQALDREIKALLEDSKSYDMSFILDMILTKTESNLDIAKSGHTLEDVMSRLDSYRKNREEKKAKETGDRKAARQEQSPEEEEEAEQEQDVSEPEKEKDFAALVQETEEIYNQLNAVVFGQNEAVRLFAQGYFQSELDRMQHGKAKKPAASFLFAGPPGVGKTFLVETAAKVLGLPFLKLNMSEYTHPGSTQELAGVPTSYSGAKPGDLTDFVQNNARCMVLFDEIEKAHSAVMNQFLQILDGGVLTDNYTKKEVAFGDAILLFTTNAGKSLYENRDRMSLASLPRSVVVRALEKDTNSYGDPLISSALCSRFAAGNLIMFNHLGAQNLLQIIENRFQTFAGMIRDAYGYQMTYDPALLSLLLFTQGTEPDARQLSSQSMMILKNELFEFGRLAMDQNTSLQNLKTLRYRMEMPKEGEETRSLFVNDEQSEILIIGEREPLSKIPFGRNCRIFYAESAQEAIRLLGEHDISLVLVDLLYAQTGNRIYLGLDDAESVGVSACMEILSLFPQIPVYALQAENVHTTDQSVFLEKGVRGFLPSEDPVSLAENVARLCDQNYLQKKSDELTTHGRAIVYNTSQKISEDGTEAEIRFYDFRIKLAADAQENALILSSEKRPSERFADVIGAENAKKELQYYTEYFKNPKKFIAGHLQIPKGLLLYGPSGTGKTMLARAFAGESDATFFPTTAAAFQDKWVGEGERKIRDLFKTARKFAPSIIFIDEIDAIGKERTGSSSTQHTETLLNTLLTEMDGFDVDPARPVFVIAATNFGIDDSSSTKGSHIDEALLRRFGNRIYVDLPNEEERLRYLKLQTAKIKNHQVSDSVLENIAKRTTGESLASLKNVLDLAIRNAFDEGTSLDSVLLSSLEEYLYGEKKEWSEQYYQSVAIHESGHAYICHLSGEKPSYVTIVSRGNYGGYMQHANEEEIPSYTRQQMVWKIRTALAGRAAEKTFFGEEKGINTGVSSDLSNATSLAMNMLCRFAMDENSLVSISPDMLLKSGGAEKLINETNELLLQEMEATEALIREGQEKIRKLADYLLQNNHATEEEIEAIFSGQ